MDTLTAIILLMGMPGVPEPQPTDAEYYALQPHVHKVALAWEILDEREKMYIFSNPSEFQQDLDMLRRRRCDMHGAPMAADSLRFPDRYQIRHMIEENRRKRAEYLSRAELELDREDVLHSAIQDLDLRYRILDACRDAQCKDYYVYTRRVYLKSVRCHLDELDWATGVLPEPTME